MLRNKENNLSLALLSKYSAQNRKKLLIHVGYAAVLVSFCMLLLLYVCVNFNFWLIMWNH